MNYQILPPPEYLRDVVKHFWTLECADKQDFPEVFKTIVDDSCGIIVQHHEGASTFINHHGYLPSMFVYGQSTRPTITRCTGTFALTGVALQPDALHRLTGV